MAAAIALVELARRWSEARGPDDAAQVVMVPSTALGVLLCAAALLLARVPEGGATARAGRLCAAAAVVLGTAVMGQYAADWILGSGQGTLSGAAGWWAQRPGPVTGVILILLGASLLARGAASEPAHRWASASAAAALVIAFTGVIGHVYGTSVLYGLNVWGGTAVASGIALSILAFGTLLADPSHGMAAVAASDSAGGYVLRRLVPAAFIAPVLLGWLMLSAQRAGLLDAPLATALLDVALAVLLVGLAVRQAWVLHTADEERSLLLGRERLAREQVTNILESITDGFFAVDREWRFTYVNREAERLLHRPREELVGRSLWTEFPMASGSTFEREYRRAMAQQVTVTFEAQYPPLDIWVGVRAFPSADGLSVYFHDVTARRFAEEQLRQSEERYRLLADMIPQHIWSTDAHGYHSYFSRRWFEYTGTSPGETEGEQWLALLHPDDRARTMARWHHCLRTGEPYAIEYRFRGADGGYRWFWGQAEPLRDEAGEIVRWIGTLTDISERKRMEAEREQLLEREMRARAEADWRRAELERVTESRNRLIRGFSHDLRNPLAAADGNAFLLEDGRAFGPLNDKQRDSVLRIRRSIRASLRLIGDLLELARAEAGQIELQQVDVNVGQSAREVAEDYLAQAMAAGLTIEVHAPPGLLARADPARMRQILANLLSNAVKYAPQGQVTITAQVHPPGARSPGACIALSVKDSGPGIPRDKHELVFQEYMRLDPGAQHGAGIGLAISPRLARLMGG